MGNTEPVALLPAPSPAQPPSDPAVDFDEMDRIAGVANEALEPSSDPAAQREAAAAPAEPAAGPETPAPPREMTKEEAIVALCRAARGTDDPSLLRAICLGCKALAREGIHKRRNRASRSARGKEAV